MSSQMWHGLWIPELGPMLVFAIFTALTLGRVRARTCWESWQDGKRFDSALEGAVAAIFYGYGLVLLLVGVFGYWDGS